MKKKTILGMGVIILITAVIYIPSLNGDFIFDDFNNIVYNYRILIKDLSPISIMQVLTCTKGGIRPLAHLSFALNYYLTGINPFYFHLTNLFFHLLNTILVFSLIKMLWEKLEGENSEKAGLIAALFFATATIQTSAVSYIVQRMAIGMTTFSLLSIILYLNKRYFYSFVCIVLALGFKENAVLVIPILFFLYYVETGKKSKTLIYGAIGFLILGILILSPYGFNLFEKFQTGYRHKGFTMWQRLITEPRVIFHYLYLVIAPYYKNFVLNYNFPLSQSLFNPITTMISIVAIILLTVFAIICKKPYISFLTGFFLISLAMENTIIPLDIAYEHRMYFPLVALSGIIAYFSVKFFHKKWVVILISILITLNTVNTFMRNTQYKDYISILKQDLRHYPNNVRALYNMYSMLLKKEEREKSLTYLKKCISLNPRVYNVYSSYANFLSTRSIDEAIEYLKKILNSKKELDKPHLLMWKIAKLYEKKGESKNALKWFSNAMKKYPGSIKIRRDFGLFLFNNGNYYYGYLNMAKAYELDNYNPLTVFYLAKMTKILKMKDKFKFFSNFYKLLYQKGRYYNLPDPVF